MSEHGKPTKSGTRDMPVIPDGGLGSSMPEWLRRPPAWKQATDTSRTHHVPEPDTSPIDPATFLDVDDLPGWLQAVARRVEASAAADQAEPAPAPAQESTEPPTAPVRTMESQPQTDQPIDATPAAIPAPSLSPAVERSADPIPLPTRASEPAWWMSEKVFGALMLAVVIVLIYVILVATEVI